MASNLRRPGFIEPMKAAVTSAPPDNGQWLYEVKFDGFRVLAVKDGKHCELWSRNHKPLDIRFPEVAAAVARLPVKRCILDGEVCALDAKGRSSFQLLQNAGEGAARLVYYVFDLVYLEGRDLRGLPLMERKGELDAVLAKAKLPIRRSAYFIRDSAKILARMETAGAEGAIAKRMDSRYETGARSGAWIKIKFQRMQEFVIAGYTLPKKSRQHFGALLLGYYEGKRLIYAGRVGTGFNDRALKEIHAKLQRLERDTPAVEKVQEPSGRWREKGWKASECRWVEPKLVAQVRFTEWTGDGILRHPAFLGLRDDKAASEVVREEVA